METEIGNDLAVELRTIHMRLSANGVEPFFWPVAREEVLGLARFIVATIKTVLGDGVAKGSDGAELLTSVSSKFLVEALSVANAQLLARRFQAARRNAVLPAQAHLWRAAFQGERPARSPFLESLPRGVPRPSTWRRYLRVLRDVTAKDAFIRRPIERVDFRNDIVCVTVCPLTGRHATDANERVVVCPLNEWLYPPTADELAKGPPAGADVKLIDDLLSMLIRGFAERGAPLPEPLAAHLRGWLTEATAWVRYYRDRLARRPERIPRKLWIGTGGIIWSRILADCVRHHGGRVTGHDHALGANFSEINMAPFTEMQSCDSFYTFTEIQAALYRRIAPGLTISPTTSRIEHAAMPAAKRSRRAIVRPPRATSPVRSILYVTPFYTYDVFGPTPLMPAIVAIDWQARLFAMLKDMGFQLLHKPHPESHARAPHDFEARFGVEELAGRFEDVYERGDLILFDFPLTTTFGFALQTEKPVVLIDFGFSQYRDRERAHLERRCAVASGWYDSDNRAHANPTELHAAIERAPSLTDPTFALDVLGASE